MTKLDAGPSISTVAPSTHLSSTNTGLSTETSGKNNSILAFGGFLSFQRGFQRQKTAEDAVHGVGYHSNSQDDFEEADRGRYARTYDEEFLQRMHWEVEVITRRLEVERRRLYTLDQAVKKARRDYMEKMRNFALKQTKTKKKSGISVSLKSLENVLSNAIAQLNFCKAQNLNYKTAIDRRRMERKNLYKVIENLKINIRQTSASLSKHVQTLDESKQEVKEAKGKMNAMKKDGDTERNQFKYTVGQMHTALDLENKVQKEMDVAHAKAQLEKYLRNGGGYQYVVADEEEEFCEKEMCSRILKISFLNCIQRRHIKQHQKNIEVFEQAFATIKSSTGISDIEQIVRIFVKLEERNFSLLNYVNMLNREKEIVEVATRNLHTQFNKMEADNGKQRVHRRRALSKLEQSLEKIASETTEFDQKCEYLNDIINRSAPTLTDICHSLSLLEETMDPILKDGKKAPKVEQLLSLIEGSFEFYKEAMQPANKRKEGGVMFSRDTSGQREKVALVRTNELPSVTAPDSDDDEDDRMEMIVPLFRNDLKQRVEKAQQSKKQKKYREADYSHNAFVSDFN